MSCPPYHESLPRERSECFGYGATHVSFEPLDFAALAHPCARGISASMHVSARYAALMPKSRVNLTGYQGVFAPNSKHQALVTPAKRAKDINQILGRTRKKKDKMPAERRASITWAQRHKQVFTIDIETCGECGGAAKVIASIEDSVVVERILTHLQGKVILVTTGLLPDGRAPSTGLLG